MYLVVYTAGHMATLFKLIGVVSISELKKSGKVPYTKNFLESDRL